MNREIKFRVWDEIHNVFIPNNLYEIVFQLGSSSFGRMIMDWKNYKQEEYFYNPNQRLNQYTGLKDRNGREIYEGDIIKFDLETENINERYTEVVEYNQKLCSFEPLGWAREVGDSYYSVSIDNIEVIGNIYENPDLLK